MTRYTPRAWRPPGDGPSPGVKQPGHLLVAVAVVPELPMLLAVPKAYFVHRGKHAEQLV
jgi:hypothetical protein